MFHKLHEHYCTFKQLVGETLTKIESTVAKQTKNVRLFLSKHSSSDNFFVPSKGYLKTHFDFSFGKNINFICSNIP